jgi:MinD-like ATPase involved in chromosome partitioning or flagellar assembly
VHQAVARRATEGVPVAFAHAPAPAVPELGEQEREEPGGAGRVVAVWGPTGAPGRSTVALGTAHALAARGWPTLLVDADVYGGTLAGSTGLAEESAGVAAACRLANAGALDAAALDGLLAPVGRCLSVLTGVDRAERWPEVRPAGLERVLEVARWRAAVTVVDCGFALEQDEEITYDTLAPRRNGATLAALGAADLVLVVGSDGPVGLRRLAAGLDELREALPGARTSVVLNRVRPGAVPGGAAAWVRSHLGLEPVAEVPLDVPALDEAAARRRWVAAGSAVAGSFERLVTALAGAPR